MNLKDFFEDKKRLTAVVIAVVACILLCFSSLFSQDNNSQKPTSEENPVYEMERRLENVLENIKGAGKVTVFIMLEDTGTKNFAVNSKSIEKEDEIQQETSTVLGGGSSGQPVLSQARTPSVKGIIVTAQGAADEAVSKSIKNAVCAALAVMPHRVEIAVGK